MAAALAAAAAGCSSPLHHSQAPITRAPAALTLPPPTAAATTTPTTTTTTVPPTTTTTDPGLLPQTTDEPAVGAALNSSMRVLWAAIVADSPDSAVSVFFPRSAYLKMKTGVIPNPSGDYADRLMAFYRLDIDAYHRALGDQAANAQLVDVVADTGYAAWIGPGHCENLIGYWHLPGVRLVYSESGTGRSFGVASLISWHSVWYVVHLGPNPRPVDAGTVDAPALGPGTPGPPGGC
jgi:hypothetical protein